MGKKPRRKQIMKRAMIAGSRKFERFLEAEVGCSLLKVAD
jgi:hypothetical protein